MGLAQGIINIAYADDHTLVRNGISSFLNFFGGIEVTIQAENGRDLILQLEKAEHLPDVCMIDINMPEMDGFDTIVAIKEKWPHIKVLVLTIFDAELYIIRMIRYGASGYMLKSVDPEQLKEAFIAINDTGFYYTNAKTNTLLRQIKNKERELPELSDMETELLKLACSEKSDEEIAQTLSTTTKHIDGYKKSLYEKFEMKNRTDLALLAMQLGLINPGEDQP